MATRPGRKHLSASTRPAAIRPLDQFGAAGKLTATDLVRLRPGLRVRLRIDEDRLVVELPDREVALPATHRDAVRLAMEALYGNLCNLHINFLQSSNDCC